MAKETKQPQPLWVIIVGWLVSLFKWHTWMLLAVKLKRTLKELRKKIAGDQKADEIEQDIRDRQDEVVVDSQGDHQDVFNDEKFNRG